MADRVAVDWAAVRDTTGDEAARDTTGQEGEAQVRLSAAADTTEPRRRLDRPVRRPNILQPSLEIQSLSERFAAQDTVRRADSLSVADTGRVPEYLPPRRARTDRLFDRPSPFMGPRAYRADNVELDTSSTSYVVRVGADTSAAMRVDAGSYRTSRFRRDRSDAWRSLAEQRQSQRRSRGGLGVNIVVPGGRESPFSTIFGKPQVDLRVNGQADINAGFDYRKSDRQVALTGDASQIDPSFKQDLRLGITGTIGDKMQIDVDWDTNNQFDYQNQVKLNYTGYEDEIIQSIEAGNVFLETPSQLINGGQSLFGIKSSFQLGNFQLTTIASQQEGQSNRLSIEGGSETNEFTIRPTEYDDNTHFFLGYFFRNSWNDVLSNPNNLQLQNGFQRITELEVWKLDTDQISNETDTRKAVAIVDYGEPNLILTQTRDFTDPVLPNETLDQYAPADLDRLRANEEAAVASTYLKTEVDQPLDDKDFQTGSFVRLERGRDYEIDENLGYISLNQRLQEQEALAVAYKFRSSTETVTVGDFSSEGGGAEGGQNDRRLILKLLRPSSMPAPTASSRVPAWYLQLRNIYRLGGRGFTAENFELDLTYEPAGQGASQRVSQIDASPLLQVLGLDRLTIDGAPSPDNQFDFIPGITIEPGDGLLLFPYLEPFGQRLADVAQQNGSASEAEPFIFRELYETKRENAERENQQKNVYAITGTYRGSTQEFYDLNAFTGIVEGSVKVTSGGSELQEGTDYVVDYQGGTVTITDRTYLAEGRDIEITYEQNKLTNLQQKTLLGARADWDLRNRFAVGATVMRLSQNSPVDKYRIGEEPIKNTIWGVDGSMNLQPRWLTQAVDAVPLIQTRAESSIEVSGEFAQLRPGHTDTEAYERTRERLQDEGLNFTSDEQSGISYVDDFEGFENTFSLVQNAQAWRRSAAPSGEVIDDLLGQVSPSDSLVTNRRSYFGWYQVNQNTLEDVGGKSTVRGTREAFEPVDVRSVFPNRDVSNDVDPSLRTLDVYFNPFERGPYNYTTELDELVREPKKNWGGFTQRLPEGYTDFSLQNVEFVEFIFRPFPEGSDAGSDAKLYLNLGTISEDIIPNGRRNSEDGLSSSFNPENVDAWSRSPSAQTNGALDVFGNRTEDLGLDGLASYDEDAYEPGATESVQFQAFLDALDTVDRTGLSAEQNAYLDAEIARARRDPSGDDYHYYNNDVFFLDGTVFPEALYPEGATVQQRFSRYYAGAELNGFQSQNELAQNVTERRGITRTPEDEDLNFNQTVDSVNEYYEYEIPLSTSVLQQQADETATRDFVVSEITDDATGEGTGWYKVRIPVRLADDPPADRDDVREVGDIDGFNLIESIRMWTTGHSEPITVRFATLELVGSQWRETPEIATEQLLDADSTNTVVEGDATLRVASINDEENANYESPLGAILSRTRSASGTQSRSREQSLVLSADDLGGQPSGTVEQRAVAKAFRGLNLLKYRRLRMYTHVHGTVSEDGAVRSQDGPGNDPLDENLRYFVRLGASETESYYEYEQRLVADDIPDAGTGPQQIWREGNEMNLVLSALNRLKVARDEEGVSTTDVYARLGSELSDAYADRDPAQVPTLKIRGTPSLKAINTIVVGVRHVGETTETIANTELWVNELRVTGYNEDTGWAVLGNANVEFADVATVNGSFRRQTDGFGSLSSTLNDRQFNDTREWDLQTRFSVDKLLPERQGWRIPVSATLKERRTNPRFDPVRGDVRVSEIVDQIEASQTLSDDEKKERADEAVERSQTIQKNRTFTASVSKSGSESWWLRNTVDGLTLEGTYNTQTQRSPSQLVNDRWQWRSNANYGLDFGQPRTVKPLWFLEAVPVIGKLGEVEFNYVPRSLDFTAEVNRSFSKQRERDNRIRLDSLSPRGRAATPFRDQQTFDHRRTFSLQYNPFEFLSLSFGTNTNQTLNEVGAQSVVNVYRRDGTLVATVEDRQAFIDSTGVSEDAFSDSLYAEQRLELKSAGEVVSDVVFGDVSPRTEQYGQRFTGTLRPSLLDSETFNWIDLQDVVYNANFTWRNASRGSPVGATTSNQVDLTTGVNLHPNKVWERFGFFRNMKEAQAESEREKRTERDRRQREKEEERRAREEENQEERTRDDAEQDPSGEDPSGNESDDEKTDDEEAGEEEDEDESDEDEGPPMPSWEDLPLPNPVNILRRVALTFLDIRDVSVNYTAGRSATSSGVGQERIDGPEDAIPKVDYSLVDALGGQGPSLGYRFGLARSIGLDNRVLGSGQQINDQFTNSNRIDARTTLTPSNNLQINLNWNARWSNSPKTTYNRVDPSVDPSEQENVRVRSDGTAYSFFETATGDTEATVWAFGAYRNVFEQQVQTLQANAEAVQGEPGDPASAADVALTNTSVTTDFRDGYLTGFGTVGSRGILPFPMPGWKVTYSGLSNWPLIRSITRSATLNHGYNATYKTSYNSLSTAGEETQFSVGTNTLTFLQPDFEINQASISERYQPLVGVSLSWQGNLQTDVDWNLSNTAALSTTNLSVQETESSEIVLRATYRKRGLDIPFLPIGRLNNQISFTLTVSRAVNDERSFSIRRALTDAADSGFSYDPAQATEGDNVSIQVQTTRLTVAPKLSYQFSNRVSADFVLEYENFTGDSRKPSYTEINGGFNVRVSISEN